MQSLRLRRQAWRRHPEQEMTEPKTSLKMARQQGKLDQFATDHDADPPGDEEAFNRLFESMAGKSKEAPEASSPDECDG